MKKTVKNHKFPNFEGGEPGIGLKNKIYKKYLINQHAYGDILRSGDRIYKQVVSIWHTHWIICKLNTLEGQYLRRY